MIVEQTVDIPTNRQLYINVPPEVPTGKTILTFIPASVHKDLESAGAVWETNKANSEELKAKLNNLRAALEKTHSVTWMVLPISVKYEKSLPMMSIS